MSQKITLDLDLNAVNVILNALAQRPFSEVFQLIDTVKSQAEQQVSPQKPETVANAD